MTKIEKLISLHQREYKEVLREYNEIYTRSNAADCDAEKDLLAEELTFIASVLCILQETDVLDESFLEKQVPYRQGSCGCKSLEISNLQLRQREPHNHTQSTNHKVLLLGLYPITLNFSALQQRLVTLPLLLELCQNVTLRLQVTTLYLEN